MTSVKTGSLHKTTLRTLTLSRFICSLSSIVLAKETTKYAFYLKSTTKITQEISTTRLALISRIYFQKQTRKCKFISFCPKRSLKNMPMWPQRSISKRHVVRKRKRLAYKLRGRRVKFTKESIDKKEEATITKTMIVEVISAEETETEEEILIIKKKRRASNSARNLLSSLAPSLKRQQLWKTRLNPTVKSPTTVWQRLQRVFNQNDRPGRTSIAKIRI